MERTKRVDEEIMARAEPGTVGTENISALPSTKRAPGWFTAYGKPGDAPKVRRYEGV